MEFEYLSNITKQASLSLDDYGNCAIEANNDDGDFWYMIIDTRYGWTRTMIYGPTDPTKDDVKDDCSCIFYRREFDGKKIARAIDSFLNQSRKGYGDITQAREVSRENALAHCKSITDYMKNEESF